MVFWPETDALRHSDAARRSPFSVEKGAAQVLMSTSARKQLNDLLDDVLTKVTLIYYSDPRDALIKGLAE